MTELPRREKDLEELKRKLIEMGIGAREMIALTLDGLVQRDQGTLGRAMEMEPKINLMEVEIDDFAVKYMALYQPEASDLRTVIMIMRMNSNLERMADHAYNIARDAEYLIARPFIKPLIDIPRMADIATTMMDDAMAAFTHQDADMARVVCRMDDQVDDLRDQVMRELLTFMISDPTTIERAIKLIEIAQNLERIGDLTTNLCEDIVYMATGSIIKHHLEDEEREKGRKP